jgi:flagellar biosynthesis/type III secretory pathway M-ring protein FliF/YscJ
MGENEELEPEVTTPKGNILQNIVAQYATNRYVLIGASVFIFVLIILLIFLFSGKSNGKQKKYKYVIAFEGLTDIDAAKIRESLTYEGILFKVKKAGKTSVLYVPQEKADEARMKMAQQALPEGGVIGFELFDRKGELGATDYDRRIKFMRAISGELSRNISHLKEIQTARVQIVVPEKTTFGQQVPGSAAVIVNLAQGTKKLASKQIKAIMHLVASSVENLEPNNVTISDSTGHILSEKIKFELANQDTIFQNLFALEDDELSPLERLLKFKNDYKDALEKKYNFKVDNILGKFFPKNSYLIASNISIAEIESKTNPFKVSKIDIAILVDENNKKIRLTKNLKQSIFSSVAASIGYVKGRDSIVLSKSPILTLEADEPAKAPKDVAKATGQVGIVKSSSTFAFKYMFFLIIVSIFFIIILKQLILKAKAAGPTEKELTNMMSNPKLIQLQNEAMENPSHFVNRITDWLNEE